ncbi:hypothetical protein [Verminephrobacter eiseniae]|nr:hypothetical protein [Verminephrobacter eiseniae]
MTEDSVRAGRGAGSKPWRRMRAAKPRSLGTLVSALTTPFWLMRVR